MFVDEVGHPDLRACHDPNGRYLSLTGIIFELDYHENTVVAWVERLKQKYFDHPLPNGEPVILHRKELINKNWPFESLRDPENEASFNRDLMTCLERLNFLVLTVSIDKLEHVNRYAVWRHHPYHYCQEVLLERFAMWLKRKGTKGDVYAEARGRKEDRQLKNAFRYIYHHGTDYLSREDIQSALVGEDLKLYRKRANIAGLQLADLIAHPSFCRMRARRAGKGLPENFGGRIAKLLEDKKYDRNSRGKVDGWGCKWLP